MSPLRLAVALVVAVAASVGAAAETPSSAETALEPPPPSADAVDDAESGDFVGPTPLTEVTVPYPDDAPDHHGPVVVQARLHLDAHGVVTAVTIVASGGPELDAAVVAAALAFRFDPATFKGEPVPVEIDFAQEFLPPPTVVRLDGEVDEAVLTGHVTDKLSAKPIRGAIVVAHDGALERRATCDAEGSFRLPLRAGSYEIVVTAPGYERARLREEVGCEELVEVHYRIAPRRSDPYETVVVGKRERTEVARTTLRGRELRQIPGTFGDPFRVITAMPGVAQVASLLNYPVVRGTSPGNTGFLLDGARVPQLFHLLAGPAVIHPAFIDRVDFYPGTFPASYGGYTGGIVDGITRRPAPDERQSEVEADIAKAGVLHRAPLPGSRGTLTLAGRYGYPGLVLGLLNSNAFFSYWDYQARLDVGRRSQWTLFAYGSFDEAGTRQDGARTLGARTIFHRLNLRYRRGQGGDSVRADLVLGADEVLSGGSATLVRGMAQTLSATPRLALERSLGKSLGVRAGLEATVRRFRGPPELDEQGVTLQFADQAYTGGTYIELPWRPFDAIVVTPGVRGDAYRSGGAQQAALDPRLGVRARLFTGRDGGTYVKGGVGIFHQPPRFFVQLPGFEEFALERGLLRAIQSSVGVESPLGGGFDLDVQGYYDDLDPIYFDFAPNASEPSDETYATVYDRTTGQDIPATTGVFDLAEQFMSRRTGRAFGLEIMLRRREVGPVFGWLAYTLSRSERRHDGEWVTYDFDRTHMLHLVLCIRLPRDWQLGWRLQLQSGRPVTTEAGYNASRTPPFVRADLRVDKHTTLGGAALDFYVDVANVTYAPERLNESHYSTMRYVLPTLGVKATF